MYSRVLPLEDLAQRGVAFWLPPGGQDNGVWADTWAVIAELDPRDVAPILALLHENDVAGYAARANGSSNEGRQLYVDTQQYNRASDVLMVFLRERNRPGSTLAQPPRANRRARTTAERPVGPHKLRTAIQILGGAALIALFLLLMYEAGPQRFPTVHPPQHPAPAPCAPAVTQPVGNALSMAA